MQTRAVVLPFNLSERDIWPGCREIELQGELDLAVSEQLRVALGRATAECRHVLLDLGACEFVDSSGLSALVHGQRELSRKGRQLLLYGAHGQVRRMLALIGLGERGLLAVDSKDGAEALVDLDGGLTLEAGSFRVSVDAGDPTVRSIGSGTWAG
jgi:anti-sigma B factor antagonist